MKVTLTRQPTEVDQAAKIWAETTAARDGDPAVPALDLSRPVIQSVLDASPRSFLLMAHLPDAPTAAGFAAVEPIDNTTAELRYLGVHPSSWGNGVAHSLLTELPTHATALNFKTLYLTVYTDNTRAITLYKRLSWLPEGTPSPHPRTTRPEQRYVLPLTQSPAPSSHPPSVPDNATTHLHCT